MRRYTSAIILALAFFNSPAYGQRPVPGEAPPKSPVKRPVKPPVAKAPIPMTGTLSITISPPVARIIIRDQRGRTIVDSLSQKGNYQTELHWGSYTIEVSADKYASQTIEAQVERAKLTPVGHVQLTPTSGSVLINLGAVGLD